MMLTSHVIGEAGLKYYDLQFVNGEVDRLVQTGLIHGANYLTAQNYTIRISGEEINKVRNWISNFQEFLRVQSNLEYRQIVATGSEIGRLREIWRIFNSNDHLRNLSLRVKRATGRRHNTLTPALSYKT